MEQLSISYDRRKQEEAFSATYQIGAYLMVSKLG